MSRRSVPRSITRIRPDRRDHPLTTMRDRFSLAPAPTPRPSPGAIFTTLASPVGVPGPGRAAARPASSRLASAGAVPAPRRPAARTTVIGSPRPVGPPPHDVLRLALPGLHPDRAVEPDRLAVQHRVLDDVQGQRRKFRGTAETRREGYLLAERGADRIGQGREKRGVENAGRDRHHADPELGEVARNRERHAHNAALRGRVGSLADLAVEGRDRRGIDDDPALTLGPWGVLRHERGAESDAVEGADEVHLDDAGELFELRRTRSPDGFHRRADASAVDEHVEAAEAVPSGLEGRAYLVTARDVGGGEDGPLAHGLRDVRTR